MVVIEKEGVLLLQGILGHGGFRFASLRPNHFLVICMCVSVDKPIVWQSRSLRFGSTTDTSMTGDTIGVRASSSDRHGGAISDIFQSLLTAAQPSYVRSDATSRVSSSSTSSTPQPRPSIATGTLRPVIRANSGLGSHQAFSDKTPASDRSHSFSTKIVKEEHPYDTSHWLTRFAPAPAATSISTHGSTTASTSNKGSSSIPPPPPPATAPSGIPTVQSGSGSAAAAAVASKQWTPIVASNGEIIGWNPPPLSDSDNSLIAILAIVIVVLIVVAILAYLFIKNFQSAIATGVTAIINAADAIATLASTLITQLTVIISGLLSFLDTVLSDITTALNTVGSAVTTAINAIGTAISNDIVPFINGFASTFNAAINSIVQFWNTNLSGIFTAITSAVQTIINDISKI